MKLINDIINELLDTDKTVTSPLLKTKVLASRIQNEALLSWVTNELKGYDNLEDLPKYRRYTGSVVGTCINNNKQYNDLPVPTSGLQTEVEEMVRSMNFGQGIAGLETLIEDNKAGALEHIFSAELKELIQQNWRKMGNPFLQLISCKKTIPANTVVEIISNVRNNLLDFMLKIDSEFGNITQIEELKSKEKEISTIMHQTIINNSGDGNVVNTGDKAKINATININKGNKEDLAKHLQEKGLSKDDTEELIEIIDSEEPNRLNGTFGQKVNSWTQKMLGKALDGSWNIGIGAAGNLIADAIKTYYGL